MAWWKCIILMHYKLIKLPLGLEKSPVEYVSNRDKTFYLSENFDCGNGQFDIFY
jgi:hypothetical protein